MKILVSDPLDESAIKGLQELGEVEKGYDLDKANLIKSVADKDVLIVRSKTTVDKEVIDSGKNLKAIVRAGVGLDNIDTEYAKTKNIKIVNTPQAPSISVAELTMGLILAMLRHIPEGDSGIKQGKWLKKELMGHEVNGKTTGIIGFGRIGSKVAKLLNAFETKILVYDPTVKEKYLAEAGAEQVELNILLEKSDIITIHAPLDESTQKMLNSEAFEKMKQGVYIVNTARGLIIDEQALCNSLETGKVAGIALDVYWEKQPFNSKIMDFKDKVVFSPHLGSSTEEAQARVGELVVQNLKEALKG